MTAVLLDTHAWAWSLSNNARLSQPAIAAITAADIVLVSPITFFEIAQKVRLGKNRRWNLSFINCPPYWTSRAARLRASILQSAYRPV